MFYFLIYQGNDLLFNKIIYKKCKYFLEIEFCKNEYLKSLYTKNNLFLKKFEFSLSQFSVYFNFINDLFFNKLYNLNYI